MNPRYQIFVSSTYTDLQEERRAILDSILAIHHFPVGMEMFPAANRTPWNLIERMIEQSDYYIVIVGGRYGSVDEEGLSFTEREYDYAVSCKIPVICFVHGDPGTLSVNKSESSTSARRKLTAFRQKLTSQRDSPHCKFWSDTNELCLMVTQGLFHLFSTDSRPGWVRADGFNNVDLLKKLERAREDCDALQRENDGLRRQLGSNDAIEGIAEENDSVSLIIGIRGTNHRLTVRVTWGALFTTAAPALLTPAFERKICDALRGFLKEEWRLTDPESALLDEANKNGIAIPPEAFSKITIQLMALGLIEAVPHTENKQVMTSDGQRQVAHTDTGWVLTTKGKLRFLKSFAMRRVEESSLSCTVCVSER